MDEYSGVDIDAILSRIASEVRQRVVAATPTSAPMLTSARQGGDFPSIFRPKEGANKITLERLLAFRDEEFIRSAYRNVLDREPDPIGSAGYLEQLRSGSLSKLDILVALRFSEEGRCVGARIHGLTRAYWARRIKNIRFVGYILQIVYGICALPVVLKNLTAQAAYVDSQFSSVRDRARELDGKLLGNVHDLFQSKFQSKADHQEVISLRAAANEAKAVVVELQHHLARLEFSKANRRELSALTERVDLELSSKAERQEVAALAEQMGTKAGLAEVQSKADHQEVVALRTATGEARSLLAELQHQLAELELAKADQHHLTAIEVRIAQCEKRSVDPDRVALLGDSLHAVINQVGACRQDLRDQHRRLGVFLELARKRMPEAFTSEQLTRLLSEESHFLDSLYVAFEDRFRGSREAVREGAKVYLPYMQKVLGKGDTASPLLDVACGRGEWLELLQTHGYPAKGIDVNRVALQQCRELGLDVVEGDALEYLRKTPANALSAVTCFHYIEHIDYTSLVTLLDEVLRVLRPGGMAIFETPNARNILVSAGDFYRDPTHRNPVFPETLESIAELRGFAESTAYCFDDTRTELIPFSKYHFDELNDYVKISRDLAWIGVKSS